MLNGFDYHLPYATFRESWQIA